MGTEKKYIYTYDKTCEGCGKLYQTHRYSSKMCSEECVKNKLSKKRKYTQEQINQAIMLKQKGLSSKDIEKQTGIKKSSQDKIFKENNIRLNEEQKQLLLGNRWKDHEPIQNGNKQCSKCKLFKSLDEFHKNNKRLTGTTSSCKECAKIHYGEHKEEITERVRVYRQKNLEKIKETNDTYYENNTEMYVAKATMWAVENPERRKEIEKAYNKRNRGQKNARTALYRASKANATPPWLSDQQLAEIGRIYKNCPPGFHVDHIVPIRGENVSGLHVPWNLEYLQAYQNESKGNTFIDKEQPVGICHQYIRRQETLEEDLKNGFELNLPIDDFIFMNEKFTQEHRVFIEKYEWLKNVGNNPKWVFTARHKDGLAGVVFISEPYKYTSKDGISLEALINRGACSSWAPKNLNSKLIMFACRWMSKNTTKRIIFGYSDHEAGEIGTIYQACNFDYLGNHFGAKTLYVLENGKKISAQYFSRTASVKKWAKILNIKWLETWNKANGFQDREKIPDNVKKAIAEHIKNLKNNLEQVQVKPKGKYVIILGFNKTEKKLLTKLYREKYWGDPLPYPKRT